MSFPGCCQDRPLSKIKIVHFAPVGSSIYIMNFRPKILLVGFGVLRLWLSHEWFLRVPKFPSEVLEYFGSGVPHNGSSFFRRSFFSPETIFGSVVEELFRLAFVPFISILNELDRANNAFQILSAASDWLRGALEFKSVLSNQKSPRVSQWKIKMKAFLNHEHDILP